MDIKINGSETNRIERASAHSHITGLGLDETNSPRAQSEGMVGQIKARKTAGIIVKMIESQKLSGRAVLIAGEPGTGKTALAMGLAQSLGASTPFTAISGSEVYSLEMSKTEALTQAFRRCISVRIKEVHELIEGEVIDITIHTHINNNTNDNNNNNTGRYGTITLKTTDIEASYDIGQKTMESLTRQQITSGDIISFDKQTGIITKLGRSYARSYDFDTRSGMVRFIQCPSGELQRLHESVHTVSLHEVDVINSRSQGFMALFSGETGEITQEIRSQVDLKLQQWKVEGKAEIIPGVLFIDEAHMLDVECFSYINRAMELDMAPIIVFATNRGMTTVRGTNIKSAHGIPADLLDRLLIIHTERYTRHEIYQILITRSQAEGINVGDDALQTLTTIATETSLRYALNLLSTSLVIATKRQSPIVQQCDVQKAYTLFVDVKRSADFIASHQGAMTQ